MSGDQSTMEHRIEACEIRLETHEKMFENYVTQKMFFWTIGVYASVVLGMFYLVYNQLQDVSKTTGETQKNVSYIQGKLDNAQITK